MAEYEDTLKDIKASLGIIPDFMKALPAEVLMSDWPLMKKYVLGESEIPGKYREMIALAIAANLKCPYCELFHTGAAKLYGISDDELKEVYFLASLTTRWSAMLHAQHYDYDKFAEEFAQIGEHLSR